MQPSLGHWVIGFALALAVVPDVSARPIRLDFEELATDTDDQSIIHGTAYSKDGITISVTCCLPFGPVQSTDLRTAGTQSAIFAGSTALRGGKSSTLIQINSAAGGTFNLLSIKIATVPSTVQVGDKLIPVNTGDPTVVTFQGLRQNGKVISKTISHNDFLQLARYKLPGFRRLVSVSWFQGAGEPNAHQFDDLRFTSVPEPPTLALLGLPIILAFIFKTPPQGR